MEISFALFFFCGCFRGTVIVDYYHNVSAARCFRKLNPVSSVIKTLLSVREVWGSNPGPVKSDTVLPPLRRFFGAVLPML